MQAEVKSSEITAILEFLVLLDIQGMTGIIDTIGGQKVIVEHIVVMNKTDYVIGLKDNHINMYQNFSLYEQDCLANPQMRDKYIHFRTVEMFHGRIVKRDYYIFFDLSLYPERKNRNKLCSLIMVKTNRKVIGHEPS